MFIAADKSILGSQVFATDGEVGLVYDLLWDAESWHVRYFVVKTHGWMTSRKVILSPHAVARAHWKEGRLTVQLTREQVNSSPTLDAERPLSRQHETELAEHYRWAPYWTGQQSGAPWGIGGIVAAPARSGGGVNEVSGDPDLRSAYAVMGYTILSKDGEMGYVEDLVLEASTSIIRYLVIDTKKWWPGRRVLISPNWVVSIGAEAKKVRIDLTQAEIKASPAWDPSQPIERDYEAALHEHYGQGAYWGPADVTDTAAGRTSGVTIESETYTPCKRETVTRNGMHGSRVGTT